MRSIAVEARPVVHLRRRSGSAPRRASAEAALRACFRSGLDATFPPRKHTAVPRYSRAMPSLADTTIRLLGQEPLAGRVPVAEQLRLAEILDKAGFAYLEVSGGGCFDAAVKRGVESPWERIRALKARVKTPLGLALRGRFLVGSRPVDADFARRFVATAAENGIDVFRLHDPLNDVSNLREAAEAIVAAERDFEAGLVYSPGRTGEIETLIERARMLPELGAVRVLLHDPTGSLQPHTAEQLVRALAEASGLPVGIYVQGAGGSALAAALAAARAGAQVIACAIYPLALTLHRVSGEALAEALSGIGLDPGVDVDLLWQATDLVDEHIGDELVTPLVPRIAVLAARHDVPASVVAGIDHSLQAEGSHDRLDEVLEELDRIREETGWPPLASPIGQVLASQAIINVLSASRYLVVVDELRSLVSGAFGTPPAPIDPALERVVQLTADPESEEDVTPPLDEVRERAGDVATSEEELLLLGLFGEDAERLLRGIRSRGRRDDDLAGMGESRTQRIQDIVRIVQESGIGEVTIEEDGMRISVRSTPDLPAAVSGEAPLAVREPGETAPASVSGTLVRVESPMVGTFYRAPQPGAPPFVEVGDVVGPGQTLCILEAMKLMNEVKADVEGVVRAVHAENATPVEFGQLLFELEPLVGRPTL
ncbi:MAG: acetyl-CoA carboxylase biotin carboxyl carrier protein [Actinobacteria bacterium]|nr:MAG: acetyl-CoA carboxylase biotin carboxyl carrier protein [Actinomycetota bacterium]